MYNSARRGPRGKLRLWKRNSDRHSSSSNHRSWNQERNHKVGRDHLIDWFKSFKSRSSSSFNTPSSWIIKSWLRTPFNEVILVHPDKQRTNINNVNKLDSAETEVSDGAALCMWIPATTAFSPQPSHRFRRPRRRPRSHCLKSLVILTPKGQSEVSVLGRCPYLRGHYDDVTFKSPLTV